MPTAEWILTFDDGPLAADVVDVSGMSPEQMLAPLRRMLDTLRDHPDGPIEAVFYLRGPDYPWPRHPPRAVFEQGVQWMLAEGHHVGLHAYRHDPDLWWNWISRADEIKQDLDQCNEYFKPMLSGGDLTVFRPPYLQGGIPAWAWAQENGVKYQLVDIDTKDWKHHQDATFPRWENDPVGHRDHMLGTLPYRMWFHTLFPGANDFLFHVSERTADFLRELIDKISQSTRDLGHDPSYVVPPEYVGTK